MKAMFKRVGILVIATILAMGVTYAAPLDIQMRELINTTVNITDIDQNGNTVISYQTNVTGLINITNNANEDLYDIWIALNLKNATGLSVYSKPSYATVTPYTGTTNVPQKVLNAMPNPSEATHFVHITLLKPNDVVSIFYDVNDAGMGIESGAPFNVSESYNVSKIPAEAENTWHVILNVSINASWFAKTALDFKQAEVNLTKFLSNDPNHYGNDKWQVLYLSSNPSAKDQAGNTLSPQTFDNPYDNADGGNHDAFYVVDTFDSSNKWLNVTFNVTGKITGVSELYALTKFGFATLQFDIIGNTNNTISGSHIVDAFAVSNLNLSVTKGGPYQNDTGDMALWIGNATFYNPTTDLKYNITAYTLWATANDINKLRTIIKDERTNGNVIKTVNPNWILNPQSLSPVTEDLKFNYSQVPVIWANCTFTIIHDKQYGWWSYENTTQDNVSSDAVNNSRYIVIEKIYVIKSYLIKVTKHIKWNKTAGAWDVYVVVENIGGMKSPEVWVYDLIPENYNIVNADGYQTPAHWRTKVNESDTWVNKSSMLKDVNTRNDPMDGYDLGIAWNLYSLEPNADGDGAYDDWSEITNNQSVVIHYQMNGTGEFHPIDAFVIGVDPMFSMNSQTAHKITIVSGAKATSYESLMALMCGLTFFGVVVISRRNGKNKE